jgi:hypothetical protein
MSMRKRYITLGILLVSLLGFVMQKDSTSLVG